MIINKEMAGSGDLMPLHVQAAQRSWKSTLVGMRTWGGLVATTGPHRTSSTGGSMIAPPLPDLWTR
jgi:hypothetical protein